MTIYGSLLSREKLNTDRVGTQRVNPLQRTAINHISNRRGDGAGIRLRAGRESPFYQQNFTQLPLHRSWVSYLNPTYEASDRTGETPSPLPSNPLPRAEGSECGAFQMQPILRTPTAKANQAGMHGTGARVKPKHTEPINNQITRPSITIQCVKKLRAEKWNFPPLVYRRKYNRVLKKVKAEFGYKNNSKRNLFVLRLISSKGDKKLNVVLRSAGMGGRHPIGIGGRSAGHTEPQAAAFLQNKRYRQRITLRLGKGWQVDSVFSSNQPCSSKGGGSAEGCGGMHTSLLGNPSKFHTVATGAYTGGKGKTQGQTIRDLGQDYSDEESQSDNSDDEYMEDVRGKDLTEDAVDPEEL